MFETFKIRHDYHVDANSFEKERESKPLGFPKALSARKFSMLALTDGWTPTCGTFEIGRGMPRSN